MRLRASRKKEYFLHTNYLIGCIVNANRIKKMTILFYQIKKNSAGSRSNHNRTADSSVYVYIYIGEARKKDF